MLTTLRTCVISQVVQAYVEWGNRSMPGTPLRQLVAFDRVAVAAGQGISCRFKVTLEQLAVWDENTKQFITPKGTHSS